MVIFAIETSCDDTCLAIIKAEKKKQPFFKILSNVISSQVKLHQKYGGIYPSLAKREHKKNLPILFKKAFRQAQGKQVDLIAVTAGPGLEPCLWVGINFAKNLAKKRKIPIVPINHIEAHIVANFIRSNFQKMLPAICLVVSGGHTQLVLMKDLGKYKILGETRDDAAGECFDKVARILGLGYPGGPAIAKIAPQSLILSSKLLISLPRPMIYQKNYDFSFSGLKTAVLYDFKNRPAKVRESKEYIQTMAAEVQQAVIDVLLQKTFRAVRDFRAKSLILGGGVAANDRLRQQFKLKIRDEKLKINLFVPQKQFCTDNAVMTGISGYYNYLKKKSWKEIAANANLRIGEEL